MRLRLTCWAEDLKKKADACFAVITLLHDDAKPTVLGKTEVIRQSNAPDFTKSFVLEGYELGEEQHLVVSLYDGKASIGSTLFEVGTVLSSGGAMAKELKGGQGVLAVRLEEVTKEAGQLNLQLRGLHLKNTDGLLGKKSWNKSDPFFEILRARKHAKTKATVWDAVYRSETREDNLHPVWPEVFLELDYLVGTGDGCCETTQLRIAVYDYDKNGKHDMIGSVALTVNDLLDNVNDTVLQDISKIDTTKSFSLTMGKEETGKLLVVKASISGVIKPAAAAEPETATSARNTAREVVDVYKPAPPAAVVPTRDIAVEPEFTLAASDDELELEPEELNGIQPTFANYVAGGCELRVIAAIDATASNGNPREASSLHHFNDHGRNEYEEALYSICSILSKYDSDQRYPVFGFGAKQQGGVSHCFPFGSNGEVEGVDGILKEYRETFRSGIVMSSPRDFSEVIREAGKNAKEELVRTD